MKDSEMILIGLGALYFMGREEDNPIKQIVEKTTSTIASGIGEAGAQAVVGMPSMAAQSFVSTGLSYVNQLQYSAMQAVKPLGTWSMQLGFPFPKLW